jgi:outer membrane protein assembly factor BamD
MKSTFRIFCFLSLIGLAWPYSGNASVVFKPGEKAKYRTPGEEEMSGSAKHLFEQAQEAEKKGNISRAIKAYRSLYKKHPKDTLAPGSLYRMGQLLEQQHNYLRAAEAYAVLTEKYPKTERFDESIEALFRIGEMYMAGRKTKILGITIHSTMDTAITVFQSIVRTAPYGKYTARAQFDMGRAYEKQGSNELAIAAYQIVVEKFPDDPLAADAQYQIGYIYSMASRSGTYDPNAAAKAKVGYEDFLARHPHSEKSAQARENLKHLEHKQTSTSFEIAKYYDKQKSYRAAAIYYNEVIRQQPDSAEGERAKKRVAELRAKFGDAKLQSPAVTAAAANRKKKPTSENNPPANTSPNDAPLPAPDVDLSLPPPASLLPDTTTAPPSSPFEATPTPAPSAAPESTPEATPTPP